MGLIVESSSNQILQVHNGPGDNCRDKITNVFLNLAPEALSKTIDLIFSNIRAKKSDIAKAQYEAIKATPHDFNSEIILDALAIHLDLVEDEAKPTVHSSLISALNKSTDKELCDLCLATLIQLDAKNNRIEDARERYFRTDTHFSFSKEKFYEFAATAEELDFAYREQRLDLDESQLHGLIRGAFRTQQIDLSLKAANRLNEIFPSFSSKVLLLLATAANINTRLNKKHFWTITATLKAEIISLIDNTIILVEESKGGDQRLFNIAAPCLDYTRAEHQGLSDVCWKYVDAIEKDHPAIAARLYAAYGNDISKITDDVDYRYKKAQRDTSYRNELLKELFAKKELSSIDFAIFSRFSEANKLKQWVSSGGTVKGRDELETDFYQLELLLALPDQSLSETAGKIEKIRCQSKWLLEKYNEVLAQLDPVALHELAERLLKYPETSVFACDFIRPLLPATDLWVSPIVESYLNALLSSQQIATLTSVLSNTNQSEWNAFVWYVQAHQFTKLHNYQNAINSIEEALKLDNNSLVAWNFLVYLYSRLDVTKNDLLTLLQRIPDNVFATPSDIAVGLLAEITKVGDFIRAEKIVVSWFIENPQANAISISNFGLGLGLIPCKDDITASEVIGDCIGGVKFKRNDTELVKLLIDGTCTDQNYLLELNSSLGQMLKDMGIGETRVYGINEITLIQRLLPFDAVLHISLKLSEEQDSGGNFFSSFPVPPDNPEEAVRELKCILSRISDNRIGNDEAINDLNYPLMWKGKLFVSDRPVEAALKLLLNEKNCKFSLPNFGDETSLKIILDVYAITYLAITGLVHGIKQSSITFVITDETKIVIQNWLADINRKDYLSVGISPEGDLWRVTADDIRQSTQSIQEAFNLILDKAEVVKPKVADVPPFMLSIQEVLDISVYSSACLSIYNDIPWLCIDELFAYWFNSLGYKQANTFKLFIGLGTTVGFKKKKDGLYLYAEQIIPYALSANDLRLLSISDDEHAHYALAKLIYLHPKAFSNTESAIAMLTELLFPVLGKAYLDGHILRGLRIHNPSNNGYAEKVFNACCYVSLQCNDGITAERKLAMLLCRLLEIFSSIPLMIQALKMMALAFITGHFMDISIINACIKEELQ